MSEKQDPIIIKRYSSRRLYNTATSTYVTTDDIAELVRQNIDLQIIDSKTGEDITRNILLQIISEQERDNETVLPINILKDVIRAYNTQAESMLPDFLEQSFQLYKEQQEQILSGLSKNIPPAIPGMNMTDWQNTQRHLLDTMFGGWMGKTEKKSTEDAPEKTEPSSAGETPVTEESDLDEIKKQLAALQTKIANM
ncbi:polyhydroxyalkanoate synthesis repressor PhaR [Kordiimonas pumila]|uniref:Polyhydroxyalkanoate synthesis repressor PhaR n=1 Tax=Kordiimonas pumila TaxID=2161677 RepID=A0ABV7D836_9PROT|nr:polyhydroxyalkanoate synthesis repressor PhaR [Kordiimonas pumila]